MHDVLDLRDIVTDEADQLLSSGYPASDLSKAAREAAAVDDLARLRTVETELAGLRRDAAWPYEEPSDDAALLELSAHIPPMAVDDAGLADRVRGAWLGRAVGNTLGKPVEGLTRQEVERYLRAAGQWPQRGYLPLLEPLPDGVPRLHPSAEVATAGRFTDVPRDDDIDWTILNLYLLERHGGALSTDLILAGWLDRLPFTQTYTAERAAYRNALNGLRPPDTATVRNPYREWIGALIRADAFGYVAPGDPGGAARLALVDARLSHTANGLYGALWAAALVAASFTTEAPEVALRTSLRVVPPRSRLAEVLATTLRMAADGVDAVAALDWVDAALGHYSWVHTLNNAAHIAIALLWGRTFMEAAAISISGGRDTDSTTATVGSVFGALHGASAIPVDLAGVQPRRVRSSVRDFDRITIDELAERTMQLIESRPGWQPAIG